MLGGRFLYLVPPPLPPERELRLNKSAYMSEVIAGDVLVPVWWRKPEEALEALGSFPIFEVHRFRHHLLLWDGIPQRLRKLKTFIFYIAKGLEIHRAEPISVIMTYGTNLNGIAAVVLKWLTGAKLIAEIPGVPHHAFVGEVRSPTFKDRIKKKIADKILSFVVGQSNMTKLLYPEQLAHYPRLQKIPAKVFHDFVPASALYGESTNERFLLALGHPAFRKGFDVLVRAFVSLASEFPDYRLKIVGYLEPEERRELESLAGGCAQVELLKPVNYSQALAFMRSCSVFVLASRSEAMGRVLLEAMAAKKPIVASRATGIPYYVRDNENGLLFESGNWQELATALRRVLSDLKLQHELGERGFALLQAELDEAAYVRKFRDMLLSLESAT